ncbi:RNA-guided endonuclease TnpB family protein [Candidatus Chlorohelix sp.]|uniref:RNA-guided endonuclease InsQ/TnpB family protein n=1 Tax=Candidatus Chlorohelix sp. TaxID=3139201 RepID=UPI003035B4DB
MLKNYKYRIYPTRKQTNLLNQQLEACRWLYNHFLAQRKDFWEQEKRSVTYHAQAVSIPPLKKEKPELANVHSQVLQNVAVRVDLAFKAFFRRVKSGEEPGYPRFKSYGSYDSITFPQVSNGGCSVQNNKNLVVSKIGHINIILHRPLEGTPKTATISRTSTGKWFVSFACELEPKRLTKLDNAVGIDVGLNTFATLSDGTVVENPRFFLKEEKALAKVQRKLAKETKGTPERRFRRKAVARTHERLGWKRQDFSHQHSRKIVNKYGRIFVEDLTVNRMVKNRRLAKSISDAAWSEFFSMLRSKAEEAGYTFIAVNPAYTSQTCSDCGYRRTGKEKLPFADRIFECPSCSLHIDRDLNAALNIKAVGLHSVGSPLDAPRPLGRVE